MLHLSNSTLMSESNANKVWDELMESTRTLNELRDLLDALEASRERLIAILMETHGCSREAILRTVYKS